MTLAMKLLDERVFEKRDNIRALMETLGLTAEKAMDALKVPEKDRPEYLKLLEQ